MITSTDIEAMCLEVRKSDYRLAHEGSQSLLPSGIRRGQLIDSSATFLIVKYLSILVV